MTCVFLSMSFSLVINTFVGLFFGSALYYVALLYTGTVAVMFMANTLRSAIPEHSHIPANAKRNYLLIGYVSCVVWLPLMSVLDCYCYDVLWQDKLFAIRVDMVAGL